MPTDADQDSSGGISTTQSTLETMRTSRNGTIRSGTIPNVQMYVLTWLYAYLFELSADINATKIVVSSWRKNGTAVEQWSVSRSRQILQVQVAGLNVKKPFSVPFI